MITTCFSLGCDGKVCNNGTIEKFEGPCISFFICNICACANGYVRMMPLIPMICIPVEECTSQGQNC